MDGQATLRGVDLARLPADRLYNVLLALMLEWAARPDEYKQRQAQIRSMLYEADHPRDPDDLSHLPDSDLAPAPGLREASKGVLP